MARCNSCKRPRESLRLKNCNRCRALAQARKARQRAKAWADGKCEKCKGELDDRALTKGTITCSTCLDERSAKLREKP